jgi:hypothetical protein
MTHRKTDKIRLPAGKKPDYQVTNRLPDTEYRTPDSDS